MQVVISGKHFDLSDRLRSHIEARADKLQRFYDPIIDCQVKVTEEKAKRADLIVNVQKHLLKATGEAGSIYLAVDQAMEKMERQLKKLNTKQRSKRPGTPA
jgi:putative sigma-54 modulation protein